MVVEQTVDVIDSRTLEQLKELIGGDHDELIELINTFLVEGDEIISDMHASVSNGDVELLRRSAHSLKAGAQDFGASRLSTLSASLEAASKLDIPAEARAQVSDIEQLFIIVKSELQQFTKQ